MPITLKNIVADEVETPDEHRNTIFVESDKYYSKDDHGVVRPVGSSNAQLVISFHGMSAVGFNSGLFSDWTAVVSQEVDFAHFVPDGTNRILFDQIGIFKATIEFMASPVTEFRRWPPSVSSLGSSILKNNNGTIYPVLSGTSVHHIYNGDTLNTSFSVLNSPEPNVPSLSDTFTFHIIEVDTGFTPEVYACNFAASTEDLVRFNAAISIQKISE